MQGSGRKAAEWRSSAPHCSIAPALCFISTKLKIDGSKDAFTQPCRCLWRAFVQITRMTPLRFIILQFSQSFLTDARTFIFSIFYVPTAAAGVPESSDSATTASRQSNRLHVHNDTARRQVVRRQFQPNFLTQREAGSPRTRSAAHKTQQPVPIGQFDTIPAVRQNFHYDTFSFDDVRSRHVRISGSASVIRTVCSK